ncbi:MAG: TonB-dependent receptor [Thermoanaerobaculia bacterium]|nr:TonB-dependent receptor [Thermoanaerobaculia bacterium]
MRRRWLANALVVAAALTAVSAAAAPPPYRGLSLVECLSHLQRQGLEVVYSEALVTSEMIVSGEPDGDSLAAVLAALLEPFGLEARPADGGAWVVARAAAPSRHPLRGRVVEVSSKQPVAGARLRVPDVDARSSSAEDGAFAIESLPAGTYRLEVTAPGFAPVTLDVTVPAPSGEVLVPLRIVRLEEVVVQPSQVTLVRESPGSVLRLDERAIRPLPRLGDDILHTAKLLPGTSGPEVSARFSVRGGRPDEVQVRLDGMELHEPYHLRDFSNALSIVVPSTVAGLDLMAGGFPAAYGDRMSAVLDVSTRRPSDELTGRAAISTISAELSAGGRTSSGGLGWLTAGRASLGEAVERAADLDEDPRFWDLFGKLEADVGDRHRLAIDVLGARDVADFGSAAAERLDRLDTRYGSSYAWLRHQSVLGKELVLDGLLFRGRVDRDRNGAAVDPQDRFGVRDERTLQVFGLEESLFWQPAPRFSLESGVAYRLLKTEYDYLSEIDLDDPLAAIRTRPASGTNAFADIFSGRQVGVYVSARTVLARSLTVEAGARYDENTLLDDEHVSPRLNLAWNATEATVLRLGWGHFYQSQRSYELGVEDGETAFRPDERSEQWIAGVDHAFAGGRGLRAEVYRRRQSEPRDRFVNLFDPVSRFPEAEPDRVRIVPLSGTASGLELFFHGRQRRRVDWWASYAWSRSREDTADGEIRTASDQPHALRGSVTLRPSERWTLSLTAALQSGAPTTPIGAVVGVDDGELVPVPVLGPLYAERLGDYHRIDARASRGWDLRRGRLELFVEILNLTNHSNPRGFEIDFEIESPDTVRTLETPKYWLGRFPTVGLRWTR